MSMLQKYYANNVPEYIPAVVGFCRNKDMVLLGVRKKSSTGLGLKTISGLGGKVGDTPGCENETPYEALVREFREEANVEVKKAVHMGNVKFIFPHKPKWTMDTSIYSVSEWAGEPTETEEIAPLWFSEKALPWNDMFKDNMLWLPRVLLGERIQATILHDEERVVDYCIDTLE